MKLYRVGGSVRDELLNLPVREKDWLVVGGTADDMLSYGFLPVGKDFPVFLHPRTKEEYALARTERKSGTGYRGFVVHAAPDVTVQEDMMRRDLTINALVVDSSGTVYDYCSRGLDDLRNKYLRHVSSAFVEDPLRLLRVARFYGRFASLGFCVAEETKQLLVRIAHSGELGALSRPRVVAEFNKCLASASPALSIELLHECGALSYVFVDVPFVTDLRLETLSVVANMTNNQAARFIACVLAFMPLAYFCALDSKKIMNHGFSKDLAKATATAALFIKLHQQPAVDTALKYLHSAVRTEQILPNELLATVFAHHGQLFGWYEAKRASALITRCSMQFSALKPTADIAVADAAQNMQAQKQTCAQSLVDDLRLLKS